MWFGMVKKMSYMQSFDPYLNAQVSGLNPKLHINKTTFLWKEWTNRPTPPPGYRLTKTNLITSFEENRNFILIQNKFTGFYPNP